MTNFPVKTTLRVRFAETDGAGIVFHGNFFVYFEVARVEYVKRLGIDVRRWGEDFQALLAEVSCRFKSPARFEDVLEISIGVSEIKDRSFRMEYQIHNQETGGLVAEGHTVHVWLDPKTWKPMKLPSDLVQKIKELQS
jgi:acyl-CoA thioester hydrolase